MAIQVIEFSSSRKYSRWLQRNGNRVRILNVSTTKRWSVLTGFLGDKKTFSVTYEVVPTSTAVQVPSILAQCATFCSACGQALPEAAIFCSSCGAKAIEGRPALPMMSEKIGGLTKWYQSKILWVLAAGTLLAVFGSTLGKSPPTNSVSTAHEDSERPTLVEVNRPAIPPPNFRIYRFRIDEPVAIVVPVNTSDEQLRSLLWFFREKIRSHRFKDIGLTHPTARQWGAEGYLSGMLVVYRGQKCASEGYTDTIGPCGYGEHDDAVYQWGINADPEKDAGSIRVNGDDVAVFDYKDGWRADVR